MFVSQYVRLAREQKSILVFPYFRRANLGCGVSVEWEVLDVYRIEPAVHPILHMFLNEHTKKLRSTRNGAFGSTLELANYHLILNAWLQRAQ
ncbi:hypothetical protein D3C76_124010 [compost metagenome]